MKIGNNTKIQSHSFICELVNIDDNCFIGHGVVFINDKFHDSKPANRDKKKWSKTTMERPKSFQSTISYVVLIILMSGQHQPYVALTE